MNMKALIFAIAGAIVAVFYALESFLSFQTNGFTLPLIVKILICAVGVYFFWRNAKRVKASGPGGSSTNSA